MTTPFFQAFGPLLFGKPPVSALAEAFARFPACSSLSQLRKAFGSYIPEALLARTGSGDNSRRRIFSLDVVFWSFFDQVQTPEGSCREAVRKVMASVRRKFPRGNGSPMSPKTAAYCKARAKIPLDVMERINAHLVDRMQNHIPHDGLWHGRRVKLADGTGLSMPDTPANQSRWPQSNSQKPGCGFPSMTLVGIFCLLTGALVQAAHGDRHTHESKLFHCLRDALNRDDLLVADRGFCSFGTFAALLARGVDSLMRLPEKKIRKAIGSQLPKAGKFDVILAWKCPAKRPPAMPPEEFALLPESLPVRVVRYTIARRGFRTQCVTLVTTLLDAAIPVPFEDFPDRAQRRNPFQPVPHLKDSPDLLRSPCRMPAPLPHHKRLHLPFRFPGLALRCPAPILQPFTSKLPVPSYPLVTRFPADPKLPA